MGWDESLKVRTLQRKHEAATWASVPAPTLGGLGGHASLAARSTLHMHKALSITVDGQIKMRACMIEWHTTDTSQLQWKPSQKAERQPKDNLLRSRLTMPTCPTPEGTQ